MALDQEVEKLKILEKELIQMTQELTNWQVEDYRRTAESSSTDSEHQDKGDVLKNKMDMAQCAYAEQIELVRGMSEQ